MGAEVPDVEDNQWPPWVQPLLRETFFLQCKQHSKSECNMYCLDCIYRPLCSLCLKHHHHHRVLQIRKSSRHDVIQVKEIQKYLDINFVQTYIINSAKVVFLNKRPQPRPCKGVINTCKVCNRGLLDSFQFCSLACKVVGTSNSLMEKDLQKKMHKPVVWEIEESNIGIVRGFSPSTPPTMASGFRRINKRKGIPHRAPLI